MATFRKWRRERSWQRSHSPEHPLDIKEAVNCKINRYQRADWADVEAKEAHASVVKYLWRKENELNKEIDKLKKKVVKPSDNCNSKCKNSNKMNSSGPVKSEMKTPLRGIHFRTVEDKTYDKLNLIKSERKLADNMSYIAKARCKAFSHVDDDISNDLKHNIRGKAAHQISTPILSETDQHAKNSKQVNRGIYDIMADRNKLGSVTEENQDQNDQILDEDHDCRWHRRYLNLLSYRMQNDKLEDEPCCC